jgi:hypothetical protein
MDKINSTDKTTTEAGQKVNLADEDFESINIRLAHITLSQLAIHSLSLSSLDEDSEKIPHLLTAISEMAMANAKGLDACIQKLGGAMGNFETEFDRE